VSEVAIRPARTGDRPACLELWRALQDEQAVRDPAHRLAPDAAQRWQTDFGWWLRSEVDAVLVAEREGAVVGMITAHPHRPSPLYADELVCWLDDLYLRPDARGLGAAALLLDAAETFARRIGAAAVEAGIQADNAEMRAVWTRRGGRERSITVRRDLG
jgi:GNAT superfamily N-acetyltransferase